jgi:hypothetical protein
VSVIDPFDDEPSVPFTEAAELPVIVGLTERERRFGEAYFDVSLEHGDHGGALLLAYRRAFPLAENTDQSARMLAARLIREPRVIQLVSSLRVALSSRRLIPAEKVTEEVERIAFANLLDYGNVDAVTGHFDIDLRRLTPATAAAISEVETKRSITPSGTEHVTTKIKLHSKLTALDQLNRVHGLYRDKLQVELSSDDIDRAIRNMEAQILQKGGLPLTIDNESNDTNGP